MALLPVTVAGVATTEVTPDASVGLVLYSKYTSVLNPLAFTVPDRVAPDPVMEVAVPEDVVAVLATTVTLTVDVRGQDALSW